MSSDLKQIADEIRALPPEGQLRVVAADLLEAARGQRTDRRGAGEGRGVMAGRTPIQGKVMMYGAPSPPIDEPWQPAPPVMPQGPWVVPAAELRPQVSPEQLVSLLMQRLQPALDELHARLDSIEKRLPLSDGERQQLDAVRAALATVRP